MINKKQKKFCIEYLIDMDGSKAAIRAGYSKKTSRQKASGLLKEPEIKKYILKLIKKQEKRTEITADKVLKEIADFAFINPKKLLDKDGNKKNISEMSEEEIKMSFLMRKMKPSDILKALELLGRHLKMFTDVMEIRDQKIEVTLTEIK